MERVTKMVSERAVVIFSKSSCCMSHTIKTLFCDFGVNPAVYELDEIPRGKEIEQALSRLGSSPSVPTVFIGGELVGGANQVMSLHLNRSLIPMLKKAGALWAEHICDELIREAEYIHDELIEIMARGNNKLSLTSFKYKDLLPLLHNIGMRGSKSSV